MRLLPALLGVATVPLAYLTLRQGFGTRRTSAILAGLLITFENGLVTQSRLILLDSPLIFFTALTAYFWVRFSNEDSPLHGTSSRSAGAFTRKWWTYLFLTGLSLGAVVSCKWVGLFTIATIGVCVIRQLWALLGDLRIPPRTWLRHFAARALCLMVVPVVFYMFMFQIHFWVLNRSGEGDGFMSSEFQHTLIGHGMEDTYAGESGYDFLARRPADRLMQMSRTDQLFPFGTSILRAGTFILTHTLTLQEACVGLPPPAPHPTPDPHAPRTTNHAIPAPRRQQQLAHHQRILGIRSIIIRLVTPPAAVHRERGKSPAGTRRDRETTAFA